MNTAFSEITVSWIARGEGDEVRGILYASLNLNFCVGDQISIGSGETFNSSSISRNALYHCTRSQVQG